MTPSQLQFSHPITGKAADIISQEYEPIECNRNRYERCTLSYPPITMWSVCTYLTPLLTRPVPSSCCAQ